MGTICSNERDKETSVYLEKILELQRELTIKEIDLEQTKNDLLNANRLLEDKKVYDWRNSNLINSRKRSGY